MTALNRHLTVLISFIIACIPVKGQQTDNKSADTDLKKAEALHRAYEFDKAEEYYTKALETTSDTLQKLAIMDHILQCRNGKSLLEYIVRLSAVTVRTFPAKDFYLYLQDTENNSWIPIPNPFIRPDEGREHTYYTSMYLPSGQQTVIYSAPDETGAWNLYTSTRKDSTSWSAPELLSENIISGHNEIFPMLSTDGRTLFFASDGLPGMGGYDLFYSRLDEETGNWGVPENMGFPYSSTGNDILYMESRDGNYSIIVSDRETPGTDSVRIYVTEYIATPVKTHLGQDESPQAIATLMGKNPSPVQSAEREKGKTADSRMADYSRLIGELSNIQEEYRQKTDKVGESRRIYETASGNDRSFIAGIIRDTEKEILQLRKQIDTVSEQVRQIELAFLYEGIIPVHMEEETAECCGTSKGNREDYVFTRHTPGKIPYITLEVPEPEFDYTFRILGRNDGQFAEDNTLPDGIVYQIQFMVLANHADVKDIRGMSPVFVTHMNSGKYLYAAGLFPTYQEAASSLSRVRDNGFPEAFIIAFNNGKSIPVKTARALENERNLSMKGSTLRTGSGSRPGTSAPVNTSYQVVLKDYGPTLPSGVLSAIREACTKDITKSGTDQETVFAVGPFSRLEDAEKLLNTLDGLDIKNASIESINL